MKRRGASKVLHMWQVTQGRCDTTVWWRVWAKLKAQQCDDGCGESWTHNSVMMGMGKIEGTQCDDGCGESWRHNSMMKGMGKAEDTTVWWGVWVKSWTWQASEFWRMACWNFRLHFLFELNLSNVFEIQHLALENCSWICSDSFLFYSSLFIHPISQALDHIVAYLWMVSRVCMSGQSLRMLRKKRKGWGKERASEEFLS